MSALSQTMVPVFGLLALGYLAARVRLIGDGGVKGLVIFVFNFSIPALLLTSMARLDFPSELEWGFLVAYYASSLAVYGIGSLAGRFVFDRRLAEQAIFGMSASFSNTVLIGIPVVLTALGPEASLPMLLIIAFHSALFMPLTVALIAVGQGGNGPVTRRITAVFGDVLRNPIILGILMGAIVNLGDVDVWSGLAALLDFLASAAVPCALFALGASLVGLPPSGDLPPAVSLSALKLVAHPLLAGVIAGPLLGLDGPMFSVPIVLAAMPTGVNVYLFGARYEEAAGVAARTVLLSTVGSVVTIWLVLTWIGA